MVVRLAPVSEIGSKCGGRCDVGKARGSWAGAKSGGERERREKAEGKRESEEIKSDFLSKLPFCPS